MKHNADGGSNKSMYYALLDAPILPIENTNIKSCYSIFNNECITTACPTTSRFQ